jgi:hypothetical protein
LKSRDYEVNVYSEGTNSFKGLGDLITSLKTKPAEIDLDAIFMAVKNYLDSFDFEHSSPIGYNLMYYKQLNGNLPDEGDYILKTNYFNRIIDVYNINKNALATINFLLKNPNYLHYFLDADEKNKLTIDNLAKDALLIKMTQEYLFLKLNYFKNNFTLPYDSLTLTAPLKCLPYTLPSGFGFTFENDLINHDPRNYRITGRLMQEVSLKAVFDFGTSAPLTDILYSPWGLNPVYGGSISFDKVKTTFTVEDPGKLVESFYKYKIADIINKPVMPDSANFPIDHELFNYFRLKMDDEYIFKPNVYATAYLYLYVKNILGFEEQRLIGKIVFDRQNKEAYLIRVQ